MLFLSNSNRDLKRHISAEKRKGSRNLQNFPGKMLKYGEPLTSSAFLPLFELIWNTEEIPENWRRGIILPLYKGKGDRSECGNYRDIILLSVPGKVFARVLLERMRPIIHAKRRSEQSGITSGRSTVDRILALCVLAQTRQEYRQPLYAAYIDLKAAFDSVDRDALFKLLEIIGIPLKLIRLFRGLYTETVSCVRCEGELRSAVRGEIWRATRVHSGPRCLQRCHGQDSRSHCLRDTSGLFNRRSLLF